MESDESGDGTEPGPSGVSEPRPGPSWVSEPVPGPSGVSGASWFAEPRPGPSWFTEPIPGPSRVSEPRPGPSRISEPRPGPSRISEPRPRPSRISEPRPGPSRVSVPGPSGKSDEELLLEHGIDRECRVVLSSAFVMDHGDNLVPPKQFRVHYGRHFLWQLAQLSYRYTMFPLDIDRLYSTYIVSRFSSLDRQNFSNIMRSFLERWEADFKKRRDRLLQEKVDQVKARRRAEKEAKRLVKITYRDQSVIVPKSNVEQAKIALRNSRKTRVVLERILIDDALTDATPASDDVADPMPVDAPMDATQASDDISNPMPVDAPTDATQASDDISDPMPVDAPTDSTHASDDISNPMLDDAPTDATLATDDNSNPQSATDVSEGHAMSGDVEDSSEPPGSPSSRSAISCSPPPCHFRYLGNERREDRQTAISGLITDMIAKVSTEQDPDGGASNQDMSSTDCYSDDTLESPMEVEFESGESPDFSKVLRDSEETCHGDEFYEDATANAGSSHQQKTITKPTVTKKSMNL